MYFITIMYNFIWYAVSMTVKTTTYHPFLTVLLQVSVSVLLCQCNNTPVSNNLTTTASKWQPPKLDTVPAGERARQLIYGKELIANTAKYFGPKGSIAAISNGMNCQNCHLDAGTRLYGNCFATVASVYPKYRDRSARVESISFRINDCITRSLNGKPIDTLSKEMQAMIAYIKWLGKDVTKGLTPEGCGIQEIGFISRACDTLKGRIVFANKCQKCHSANGEGFLLPDSSGYIYPPLWGLHSFNTAAGMYRVGRLASFIQKNMPYSNTYTAPQLSEEEAWHLAGFINSQERPFKKIAADWKDINSKPVDYPFGPFADSFTELQHKYGPFTEMQKKKSHRLH